MKYLMIGNSIAAVNAVEAIRQLDKTGQITIISEENYPAYGRPLISYWLSRKVSSDSMEYRSKSFYERNKVDVKLGKKAESIDIKMKIVTLSDGTVESYDKLLIATGGRPILPPMEGRDEVGYTNFIKFDDAKALDALAQPGKRALVIGGGFIGLKAAEALIKRDVQVDLVERADWVLSTMLDIDAASIVQSEVVNAGIKLHTGVVAESAAKNGSAEIDIKLSDGSSLVCDFVVIAVGVVPNSDIAKNAGISVDRGILVNSAMATDMPDVWAAGDVAQGPDLLTGQSKVSAILPNASLQGKVAGNAMAGGSALYDGSVPFNSVGVFGVSTISMGDVNISGEGVEVITELVENTYRRIVIKNGRIKGAVFVNNLDRAGILQGLIRMQTDVSKFKDTLLSGDLAFVKLPLDLSQEMMAR